MLDRLDSIRWEELTHAYGSAEDTPRHLRALASADPDERRAAAAALDDSVCLGGNYVCDATAPCVQFLAELLLEPSVPDKATVLSVLSAFSKVTNVGMIQIAFKSPLEPLRNEDADQDADEFDDVAELRGELNRFVGAYLPLLDDVDAEVRATAASLLAQLPEVRSLSVPQLVRRFESEAVDDVRVMLLWAIAELDRSTAKTLAADVAGGDPANFTTLQALALLVDSAGDDRAPAYVFDRLTNSIVGTPDERIRRFDRLAEGDGFFGQLALPIAVASRPHAERILDRMLEYAKGLTTPPSPGFARALLTAALRPSGSEPELHALAPEAEEAVAVVARAAWPDQDQVDCALVDVLEEFGLPTVRDTLVRMLPEGTLPIYLKRRSISEIIEVADEHERNIVKPAYVTIAVVLVLLLVRMAWSVLTSAVGFSEEDVKPGRKYRRVLDEIDPAMREERDRIMAIAAKSDNDLTDDERNVLILCGFAKEDHELSGEDRIRLDMYRLNDVRKKWREHHQPLPKEFISDHKIRHQKVVDPSGPVPK